MFGCLGDLGYNFTMDYTNHQLDRIRHVNEMKRRISSSKLERKFMYCAGANLILVVKGGDGKWLIEDETGPWNEIDLGYWEETEQ